MLKFGVVGAGIWGHTHLKAYSQHPGVEVTALCDINGEKARKAGEDFGVRNIYTDIEQMLNEKLDGVSVATPDNLHTDIALALMDRGINVLVEKPLATTVAECQKMVEASEKNGVILMVDWHNRWNPPMFNAKRAIEENELGKIRYVYYRLSDTVYAPLKLLPWADKTSVMWFLGSHSFDTVCWLINDKPVDIFAQKSVGTLRERGVDTPDLYVSIINFEHGAKAVVENLWILPQSAPSIIDHKCEIVGDQGVIYIDPSHHRGLAKYSGQTGKGFPHESFPDLLVHPVIHGKQMGFALESIYHFVDCVQNGEKPIATGTDGLLNTKLITAAEKSIQTGSVIPLE